MIATNLFVSILLCLLNRFNCRNYRFRIWRISGFYLCIFGLQGDSSFCLFAIHFFNSKSSLFNLLLTFLFFPFLFHTVLFFKFLHQLHLGLCFALSSCFNFFMLLLCFLKSFFYFHVCYNHVISIELMILHFCGVLRKDRKYKYYNITIHTSLSINICMDKYLLMFPMYAQELIGDRSAQCVCLKFTAKYTIFPANARHGELHAGLRRHPQNE